MLTGIFSPKLCAQCKLCCNFRRVSAWETPALEPAQIFLMHELCVPLEERADGTTSFFLNFQTENPDEVADCPMLDSCSGCTLPRSQRPFECRIWPVRIMKEASTLVVGIYKDCPALDESTFEKLKAHTLDHLLPQILSYAKRNPRAVREFNTAYQIIWRS